MEIDAERKRSPHPNPKPEPNPKPKPLFTLPYICVQETIDRASERASEAPYRFTCASCALRSLFYVRVVAIGNWVGEAQAKPLPLLLLFLVRVVGRFPSTFPFLRSPLFYARLVR
jgi:hypothetical protein